MPQTAGAHRVSGPGPVEILRDRWGIPRVCAGSDETVFFGFGYAMAQDRLWQMDYLRRRAYGRLAEILGPDGLSLLTITAASEGLPLDTIRALIKKGADVNAKCPDGQNRRKSREKGGGLAP